MKIDGKISIVTGAASGLGAATARRLAAEGSRVALFDRNETAGAALADEIGGRFFNVDVTSEAAAKDALATLAAEMGCPRVLVNCAGIAPPAKVINRDGDPMPLASFARVIEINLIGTFNMIAQFAAQAHKADLIGEERGVIVNTASIAAYEGQIGQAAYAASKGGVASLAMPIARELARHAIRVNTIAPGIFKTPMLQGLPEEAQRSLAEQNPFPRRLGDPAEFADLVATIVANPMLNGEVIRLDAALRMAPS